MRLFLLLVSLVLAVPSRAVADEALWQLMRGGGQVILMRHAVTTPGVGDPTGFQLDDCSTQRNLTDVGREDARRVGATFKARSIPVGRVLSSPWCRCLETARHTRLRRASAHRDPAGARRAGRAHAGGREPLSSRRTPHALTPPPPDSKC
jgi:hypothetical protein